jgi:hypothetical protein
LLIKYSINRQIKLTKVSIDEVLYKLVKVYVYKVV